MRVLLSADLSKLCLVMSSRSSQVPGADVPFVNALADAGVSWH